MIKVLEDREEKETILTVAIAGLTVADWERVIPELQKKIQQYGRIRWYFEMEDFRKGSEKTTWEEVGLDQLKKRCFRTYCHCGRQRLAGLDEGSDEVFCFH